MKRITTLIMSLILMATTATADDIIASTTLPTEGKPEHIYRMTSGSNITVGGDLCPGGWGKFAFYEVEGEKNTYTVYSITNGKWVCYNPKENYDELVGKSGFLYLKDFFEACRFFNIEKCREHPDYYQIRPYTYFWYEHDIPIYHVNYYLNIIGGSNANFEETLGLYGVSGDFDPGSRFLFTADSIITPADLNPYKCYTMTTARGAWTVRTDFNTLTTTSSKGEDVSSDNVDQHFAVLTVDDTVDDKNYYLYSVAAQKFVAYANQYQSDLVAGVGTPIVFHDASNATEFRVKIEYKNSKVYFNIDGSHNPAFNSWDTVDEGNSILFTEVGGFDPTKAYKMLKDPSVIEGLHPDDATTGVFKGIYDLTGRRLTNIAKPGVYIIDGKKQVVKK